MAKPGDFDFYCEKVFSGEVEVKKVYESDNILAFYHTKPVYETHIVVVPKKHIHDISSVKDEELSILNEIVKVCRDIMKTFDYENKGGRIINNSGIYADTPHLHFHVICGEKIR